METQTLIIIFLVSNVVTLLAGFGVGIITERLGWHKLIVEGKLPKPAYWGSRIVCNNGLIRGKK